MLLFSGINTALFPQSKPISGIINSYGRVTSFGLDYVTVKDDGPNAGQFAAFEVGDTVLLIQMKGARIQVVDALYGQLEGTYGVPGQHEFLIIESINPGAKQITFRNNISHTTFSTIGDLQIVKVPTYNAATVVSKLTCAPWDSISKTGGVLTLITGRTLTLNDSISVIGKGFRGGATSLGMGICAETPKMYKNAYAATGGLDSAGFKGESPASRGFISGPPYPPLYPGYAKGKGANLSGGGGGDGKFSGGGGGGNYGGGGTGGREAAGCITIYPGGLGGQQIKGTYLANTLKSIFLGSGGGASTYTSGTPTPGGNGGGIIILISDTIKAATNKFIAADGAGAKTASGGNAGAGGGGGGGTVAIYTTHYANLTITAKGGKGGDNPASTFGEGGGGGGGLITSNTPASSTAISRSVAGGAVGDRSGTETGAPGSAGDNLLTWVPILNGFLFNSIRSSVTNTQTDSICSNVTPAPVTGTMPVGGSGNYNYVWQKSINSGSSWTQIASGAAFKDYSFSAAETDTFLIRRIVVDLTTTLTDTSKWVQINVTPAITGNLVGKDTTICNGQNPLSLIPLNSGPSNGNGHYQYQWLQNTDNLNWTTSPNASGTSIQASFDPPILNTTTYYQRKITSGRCVNYSSSVTITVLPSITGNIIDRPDSVICEGSAFNVLSASLPGGGSGVYTYLWQDSITSGIWQPASGTNTAQTHDPAETMFATVEHRYFRRAVISGPDDVCKKYTAPIRLTMWQAIENNIVSAPQTICSGDTPVQLTGLTPTQGDHTYTYQWQDSSKTATWTSRSTTGTPYAPPALTDTTWYRRVVNSSKCTSTSNKIVVNVHDPITNNTIAADTTICNGGNPNQVRGKLPVGGNSIFAYQWYSSTDNFGTNNVPIAVAGTLINYDPPVLSADRSYRREVTSGMCKTLSNIVKVTVLPSITNNTITPDKAEVCFNTVPGQITGTPLTGGAGGTPTWIWQDSTSGIAFANISGAGSQNYTPASNLTKQTWYRRIIKSGPADCCISVSPKVSIDTIKLPTATITSVADTTICGGKEVKLRVLLTGAKNWNLVYNENTTPVTVSSISSANYTITRSPAPTSSMTAFNYTIASLTDANNCSAVATGITGSRKANVYRVPVANAGPAQDVVCGTAVTLAAVPTDGTGTWTFPAQVVSGNPSLFNASVQIASFSGQSVTYKFYWQEVNWTCTSKDSTEIKFDHEITGINAGTDASLSSFDGAIQLQANPLQSYETGKWTLVAGSGVFDDDALNSTWVRFAGIGVNTYKWTIVNGECTEEDQVTYVLSNPVVPEMISPNDDGINDILIIEGLNFDNQVIELTILNGAGALVFSTSNENGNDEWKDWDGKNSKGEELPEGTYYYLLEVDSPIMAPGIDPTKKSGFIILKRK